jgi:hypothetical protein
MKNFLGEDVKIKEIIGDIQFLKLRIIFRHTVN